MRFLARVMRFLIAAACGLVGFTMLLAALGGALTGSGAGAAFSLLVGSLFLWPMAKMIKASQQQGPPKRKAQRVAPAPEPDETVLDLDFTAR